MHTPDHKLCEHALNYRSSVIPKTHPIQKEIKQALVALLHLEGDAVGYADDVLIELAPHYQAEIKRIHSEREKQEVLAEYKHAAERYLKARERYKEIMSEEQ